MLIEKSYFCINVISHIERYSQTDGDTLKLYAQWDKATYPIRFHGNGADSGSMEDMICYYGIDYTLPANSFKRTGYKFTKWSHMSEGETKAEYSDKQGVCFNMKNDILKYGSLSMNLYAQWEPVTYTIAYDGNGSTGGTVESMASCVYDTSDSTITTILNLDGYAFMLVYSDAGEPWGRG